MNVRPMIGEWEVPRIERVRSNGARRLRALPVPGLSGDLHQDLGRQALRVEIEGSLSTDEARDEFLATLREKFYAAEPVDFVADIVNEAELEQVLIDAFDLLEDASDPDRFRYRIRLREYTEPPEPPAFPDFDLGADLLPDIGLDIDLGLDLLDLPGLVGAVPDIGDLLSPVEGAAEGLKETMAGAPALLTPLADLLGGGS